VRPFLEGGKPLWGMALLDGTRLRAMPGGKGAGGAQKPERGRSDGPVAGSSSQQVKKSLAREAIWRGPRAGRPVVQSSRGRGGASSMRRRSTLLTGQDLYMWGRRGRCCSSKRGRRSARFGAVTGWKDLLKKRAKKYPVL